MSLVAVHFRAQTRELLRYPAFVVPTLLLPAMFFLFLVAPRAGPADASLFMASYAAFAVLGIAFFQFGVGIAGERRSPWEVFLRTLPVSPQARFAARLLTALVFALAAASVVVAAALLTTPARLPPERWVFLAAALLAGSIPFALLGIAIGYWTQPKAALPIANVLYLLLAYSGGLWTGGEELPSVVRQVSPYLPTRQWGEGLWAVVLGRPAPLGEWLALLAYAAAFALLALAGYRRDEGERFR